jgi:hypothetical protein
MLAARRDNLTNTITALEEQLLRAEQEDLLADVAYGAPAGVNAEPSCDLGALPEVARRCLLDGRDMDEHVLCATAG